VGVRLEAPPNEQALGGAYEACQAALLLSLPA
jgi:hypothetical protein